MVKKLILKDEIMCFLLLVEASEGFILALRIVFVVGVGPVIIKSVKLR